MAGGEAVISPDRVRRFDTLPRAPARLSTSANRTASVPHHPTPSTFRTLRTMPAESVGLALPAAGRFRLNPAPPSRKPYVASSDLSHFGPVQRLVYLRQGKLAERV